MVLARELNLKQVAEIVRQIASRDLRGPKGNLIGHRGFRSWSIVHGHLMANAISVYILILHLPIRCPIQNCRRSYVVSDKETGTEFEVDNEYIMSAKIYVPLDFSTRSWLPGKVLKIEGRGRAADYVHTVTSCYRETIDAWYDGNYSKPKVKEWIERLSTVYNRGFWDGYYLGTNDG